MKLFMLGAICVLLIMPVKASADNLRSIHRNARSASIQERARYEEGRLSRYKRHLHRDWNRLNTNQGWVNRNGWRTYETDESAHRSFKRHNKVYD